MVKLINRFMPLYKRIEICINNIEIRYKIKINRIKYNSNNR